MFLKSRAKDQSEKNIFKDKDAAKIRRSAGIVYENNHLGGFKKIYPVASDLYPEILKKLYCKKLSTKVSPKLRMQH